MENQLREDLKEAQLMENELVVATLRLLLSEIRNAQIAKGQELSDDEIVSVLQKELKKRREAAEAFKAGNRIEMAEREEAEAAVLQKYLPAQMSDEELTKIVEEVIKEVGATEIKDMGRVIGAVRGKVGSSADGSKISQIVKEKLS
jgi:uncharacterized protein YqeY